MTARIPSRSSPVPYSAGDPDHPDCDVGCDVVGCAHAPFEVLDEPDFRFELAQTLDDEDELGEADGEVLREVDGLSVGDPLGEVVRLDDGDLVVDGVELGAGEVEDGAGELDEVLAEGVGCVTDGEASGDVVGCVTDGVALGDELGSTHFGTSRVWVNSGNASDESMTPVTGPGGRPPRVRVAGSFAYEGLSRVRVTCWSPAVNVITVPAG
jgi:hypothetical protein